jgi:hypothetical protein
MASSLVRRSNSQGPAAAGIDYPGLRPVLEVMLCIDVVSDNDNADGSLLQIDIVVNSQFLTTYGDCLSQPATTNAGLLRDKANCG